MWHRVTFFLTQFYLSCIRPEKLLSTGQFSSKTTLADESAGVPSCTSKAKDPMSIEVSQLGSRVYQCYMFTCRWAYALLLPDPIQSCPNPWGDTYTHLSLIFTITHQDAMYYPHNRSYYINYCITFLKIFTGLFVRSLLIHWVYADFFVSTRV